MFVFHNLNNFFSHLSYLDNAGLCPSLSVSLFALLYFRKERAVVEWSFLVMRTLSPRIISHGATLSIALVWHYVLDLKSSTLSYLMRTKGVILTLFHLSLVGRAWLCPVLLKALVGYHGRAVWSPGSGGPSPGDPSDVTPDNALLPNYCTPLMSFLSSTHPHRALLILIKILALKEPSSLWDSIINFQPHLLHHKTSRYRIGMDRNHPHSRLAFFQIWPIQHCTFSCYLPVNTMERCDCVGIESSCEVIFLPNIFNKIFNLQIMNVFRSHKLFQEIRLLAIFKILFYGQCFLPILLQ